MAETVLTCKALVSSYPNLCKIMKVAITLPLKMITPVRKLVSKWIICLWDCDLHWIPENSRSKGMFGSGGSSISFRMML
ncbi:hypothetical protein MAR_019949 [Mya arenaria]|uniref:Uncharacterized protein n=1 Tax=Mya arenaria TaxID=6604 RepID=A0ABY7E3L4_MYAAR|nr:hypothetical protein MAR_019949 [Mya arenaria]